MNNKGLLKRAARGFTLVELLVVMVVVAILGTIMFPVFIKSKETAKISECLSNMRQIGAGLRMYMDDYGDRFPAAVSYGSPEYWQPRNRNTLQGLLQPYVMNGMVYEITDGKKVYVNAGVFRCPSDSGVTDETICSCGIEKGMPVWKSTGSSYEYYASVQEDWAHSSVAVPWTSLSPLLASASGKERVGAPYKCIAYPTKKAVIGDLCLWHLGDQTPDNCVAYSNTLFADGHASRVRGTDHLEARLQQLSRWHTATEISSEK
ncbi:MAG: prepilin-type N-terminal cleavage/methylation domain-containing protein [Armatimonadota bacterium]